MTVTSTNLYGLSRKTSFSNKSKVSLYQKYRSINEFVQNFINVLPCIKKCKESIQYNIRKPKFDNLESKGLLLSGNCLDIEEIGSMKDICPNLSRQSSHHEVNFQFIEKSLTTNTS